MSVDISIGIAYNGAREYSHGVQYHRRRAIYKGRASPASKTETGHPVRSHREQEHMECLSCGSQIPDVSRFCLNCGQPTANASGACPLPPSQPLYAVSPLHAPEPMTPDEARRVAARLKSYAGPAVLVFFLYWICWLPGFLVNWVFYREAKDMERIAGQGLPGTGCLALMLWLNLLGVSLMLLACCIVLVGASRGLI